MLSIHTSVTSIGQETALCNSRQETEGFKVTRQGTSILDDAFFEIEAIRRSHNASLDKSRKCK